MDDSVPLENSDAGRGDEFNSRCSVEITELQHLIKITGLENVILPTRDKVFPDILAFLRT